MGRRSRKRSLPAPEERAHLPAPDPVAARAPAVPVSRRARMDEAPKPPWAPFPLVELCILVGIVLLIGGFLVRGSRGGVMVLGGLALVGLSALELVAREHFSGFRSHSALIALAATVATIIGLTYAAVDRLVVLGAAVVVFVAGFTALRRAFRRRTGGPSFRA